MQGHFLSKFDQNVIRRIFVGYDNQRKWWRCSDPTSGWCYTTRNVVFNEASSWWSLEKEELPDSKEIEDQMTEQIVEIQPSQEEYEESDDLKDDDDKA